jgi:hypothetical protein
MLTHFPNVCHQRRRLRTTVDVFAAACEKPCRAECLQSADPSAAVQGASVSTSLLTHLFAVWTLSAAMGVNCSTVVDLRHCRRRTTESHGCAPEPRPQRAREDKGRKQNKKEQRSSAQGKPKLDRQSSHTGQAEQAQQLSQVVERSASEPRCQLTSPVW